MMSQQDYDSIDLGIEYTKDDTLSVLYDFDKYNETNLEVPIEQSKNEITDYEKNGTKKFNDGVEMKPVRQIIRGSVINE